LLISLKSLVSISNGTAISRGVVDNRDNPDSDDIEYPPPQPLDGEIDRLMETDGQIDFVVASDGVLPENGKTVEHGTHPASDPIHGAAEGDDEIEDLGSEDDEDDEEEDDAEIDLDEEEVDEEEGEGEEDEEMQEANGQEEDVTMQSIEQNGPSHEPIAQAS